MNLRTSRRVLGAVSTLSVAAALLVAPSAAGASPLPAEESGGSCAVTEGTLTWGVKESFRAYISGSIANGSWEVSDGAEYEIPSFVWSNPTGEIDPETGTGSVSFTGTVHFTGHDGVLDLTLANPTIEFEGDGTAALLLDARSTDMEGEVAVDEVQEWVGAITAPQTFDVVDDQLELSEMPASLTNSGAGAFAGFYEADTELDPINLSLGFEGCEGVSSTPAETADPEPEATTAQAATQRIPWLPIGVGGAALFVIGLTVGLLIGGRRSPQKLADAEAGAHAAGHDHSQSA